VYRPDGARFRAYLQKRQQLAQASDIKTAAGSDIKTKANTAKIKNDNSALSSQGEAVDPRPVSEIGNPSLVEVTKEQKTDLKKTDSETEAESEEETEVESEAESEFESESESESEAESKSDLETESGTEVKTKAKAESESELGEKTENGAELSEGTSTEQSATVLSQALTDTSNAIEQLAIDFATLKEAVDAAAHDAKDIPISVELYSDPEQLSQELHHLLCHLKRELNENPDLFLRLPEGKSQYYSPVMTSKGPLKGFKESPRVRRYYLTRYGRSFSSSPIVISVQKEKDYIVPEFHADKMHYHRHHKHLHKGKFRYGGKPYLLAIDHEKPRSMPSLNHLQNTLLTLQPSLPKLEEGLIMIQSDLSKLQFRLRKVMRKRGVELDLNIDNWPNDLAAGIRPVFSPQRIDAPPNAPGLNHLVTVLKSLQHSLPVLQKDLATMQYDTANLKQVWKRHRKSQA